MYDQVEQSEEPAGEFLYSAPLALDYADTQTVGEREEGKKSGIRKFYVLFVQIRLFSYSADVS